MKTVIFEAKIRKKFGKND